jgi:hypothetical protein
MLRLKSPRMSTETNPIIEQRLQRLLNQLQRVLMLIGEAEENL